jgi:hypothetical protein
VDPVRSSSVPGHEAASQIQAVLRMFRSRRTHTCPGCGRMLGQWDEVVRMADLVYHESCAQQRLQT